MSHRIALAVTCHDPEGGFAAGIPDAAGLWQHVGSVAVNVTRATDPVTIAALVTHAPDLIVEGHTAGAIGVGAARRRAVELAAQTDCTHVAYSDLDHVLRWSLVDSPELQKALTPEDAIDLMIIGRSPGAFESEPARLRLTEGSVNVAASLAVGQPVAWDFMIAVRLMTTEVAHELVANCAEDTIGSDVAWPLHAQARGWKLGFRPVDAWPTDTDRTLALMSTDETKIRRNGCVGSGSLLSTLRQ